ncbi:Ca2+-binding protein, RTX toxin [Herbaspirillum sp. YR522]|nr:Ca2+-binding protein, RTX toxin [Herbaspirillum sp. YR522]
MGVLTLTATQVAQIKVFQTQLNNGNLTVGQVWGQLAGFGDSYAVSAVAVINQPGSLPWAIVRSIWDQAGADFSKFDVVAAQHLNNYIDEIVRLDGAGDLNLPTTDFIEKSYVSALRKNQISPYAAIDILVEKLITTTTMSWLPHWYNTPGAVMLEAGRVRASDQTILADVDEGKARSIWFATGAEGITNTFLTAPASMQVELATQLNRWINGGSSYSLNSNGAVLYYYNAATGNWAFFDKSGTGSALIDGVIQRIDSSNWRYDSGSKHYQILDQDGNWKTAAVDGASDNFVVDNGIAYAEANLDLSIAFRLSMLQKSALSAGLNGADGASPERIAAWESVLSDFPDARIADDGNGNYILIDDQGNKLAAVLYKDGSYTELRAIDGSLIVQMVNDGHYWKSVFDTSTGTDKLVRFNPDGSVGDQYPDTGSANLPYALAATSNFLSLVQAIQSGKPLPILTAGVNTLVNMQQYAGEVNTTLSGAATALNTLSTLAFLQRSIRNGDALGTIYAGAQLTNIGAHFFQDSLQSSGVYSYVKDSVTPISAGGAVTPLDVGVAGIGTIYNLEQGNYIGAITSALALIPVYGQIIAIAGMIVQLITGDEDPPSGSAKFDWNADGSIGIRTLWNQAGGGDIAANTLSGFLSTLKSIMDDAVNKNPGAPLGLIPNRMPSITYGGAWILYDMDPVTGRERGLTYDANGRPTNAIAGSPEFYRTLAQQFIYSSLGREAIAPLWEVETAHLQTLAGDPQAGLTELQRAQRNNQLAPSLDPNATVENWRPVVFDLNGDGIKTVAKEDAGIVFDIDSSGFYKATSWISKQDAFLVLDRNYNGIIDDASEIFSNGYVSDAARGLAGLTWVDANGDGNITSYDPVFNELRIWQDVDGNGVVNNGEVRSLQEWGITALQYALGTYDRNGQTYQLASPDLQADAVGVRTHVVEGGIIVESSNGSVSMIVTKLDDLSNIAPGMDRVANGIEDIPLNILANDLLKNDKVGNVSGAGLVMTSVGDAKHGIVNLQNGIVYFTPEKDYFGADAGFTYWETDGFGNAASANVQINLAPVNDAPEILSDGHQQRAIYGFKTVIASTGQDVGTNNQADSPQDVVTIPIYSPGMGAFPELIPGANNPDDFTKNYQWVTKYHDTPVEYFDLYNGKLSVHDADGDALSYSVYTGYDTSGGEPLSQATVWSVLWETRGIPTVTGPEARVYKTRYGQVLVDQDGNWAYVPWEYGHVQPAGTVGDIPVFAADQIPTQDAFEITVIDSHGASSKKTIVVTLPMPVARRDEGGAPIVLDLDRNGITLQSAITSSAFYDIKDDGWRYQMGWTTGGDGLLAFDANDDGKISGEGELSFKSYVAGAQTDLEGLAAFDSNKDGKIDSSDALWNHLRVWQDSNGNGLSEDGEVKTLSQVGVQAISLSSDRNFSTSNGNTIHGMTQVTMDDNSTIQAADVTFQVTDKVVLNRPDGSQSILTHSQFSQPSDVAGSDQADTLVGTTGNNHISAGAGDDFIYDDQGNDAIEGGDGNDVIYSGADEDVILAGDGRDTVFAGNANDLIFGEGGADALFGEAGNDVIFAGEGNDFVDGGLGNDVVSGDAGDDEIYGNNGSDALFGGDGDDMLSGGDDADQLQGDAGDDFLDGGAGADKMTGGSGDDIYVVDSGSDVVVELAGEGRDTVRTNLNGYVLASNVENLTLTDAENAANPGSDTDTNNPRIARTASGNALDNVIIGNRADNTLDGGAGNDVLDGGAGVDTLIGGVGDDTYIIDSVTDNLIEKAGEGNDTVKSSISFTLKDNFENLILSGIQAINGTGNAGDNSLTGNSASNVLNGGEGDDTLDGGAGADILVGGSGDDTYFIDNVNDVIVELDGDGTDTVKSSIDFALSGSLENLTLLGVANNGAGNSLDNAIIGNDAGNSLFGNEGNDQITSGAGNDIIDGGLGADIMAGGGGDDIYIVDNANDVVIENSGDGIDQIRTSESYTLGANIEQLVIVGNKSVSIGGNSLDNVLTGNDAGDVLSGGAGNDTLVGGAGDDILVGGTGIDVLKGGKGNDTYDVDSAQDIITENAGEGTDTVRSSVNYTLTANLENLTLTGSALTGTGNELDNKIVGNSLSNTLVGGAGNDVLDGGEGADTLKGGTGNDVYYVDNVSDTVIENTGEGTDTVISSVDYILGSTLENLTLVGGAKKGTGNSLNNILIGNDNGVTLIDGAGDDILIGGAGDDYLDPGATGLDTLIGGAGNDTYTIHNGDTIVELAGGGIDTVRTYNYSNYVLGDNLENLTLIDGSTSGSGNALDNVITGNNLGNTLSGAGGNDTLIGGTGNDVLDGGIGADSMSGGAGGDTYIVDDIGDTVTETAGAGGDLVKSSISYTLGANVENLTLTGTSSLTGTGNELDNILTANDAGSILIGGAGNDMLSGGAGRDVFVGGTGNDTYGVDQISDVIVENAGEGVDTVKASINYTLGTNLENLTLIGGMATFGMGNDQANIIIGNNVGDTLSGGAGNDTITGGTGNDVIDGGTGTDTMAGGAGDDIYFVDSSTDIVTENSGAGSDSIFASISYTLSANVENLTFTGSTAGLVATGNASDNVLTANSAGATLNGGAGNDTLIGGAGNDALVGGTGNDIYMVDQVGDSVTENANEGTDLVRSSINYTLGNNVENLTLTGTAATVGTGNALDNIITANDVGDTLSGGAGNDTLVGGAGNDTLVGGVGNDTYVVGQAGDIVAENLNEGTDLVQSSINYTLGSNLENLTLNGVTATIGTGNELANVIVGNNAGDILSGGAGNDTITGGSGSDVIDGGVGNDAMSGGAGDDTYIVDSASDLVSEAASAGTDLVQSSVSYTLSTNVENLTLTGAVTGLTATGNASDNVLRANSGGSTLSGGAGNDTLIGGAGNDALIGGQGNDTYYVDQVGDVITENASEGTDLVISTVNYTLATNVENLTLKGSATQGTGNALDNILTGNDLGDTLSGGAGNDTLIGGVGLDTLIGGAGNDIYVVAQSADVVTENSNEGTDTVQSSADYTLGANVENLTLTGSTATIGTGNELANVILGNGAGDSLSGGAGNDTITGGAGNDIIDGGTGNDTMAGGFGDDIYIVDSASDVVNEGVSQGVDTVKVGFSYTAGANIENVTLTGTTAGLTATGNALDNILTANDAASTLSAGAGNDTLIGGVGNDTLDGGTGNDSMSGGAGDDTYIVDSLGDIVTEGAGQGTDIVKSSVTFTLGANLENLTLINSGTVGTGNELNNILVTTNSGSLYGGAGNDILTGSNQNDVLDGGTGDDQMAGGLGNDIYVVDSVGDVITETASAGTDEVQSSISYTLSANFENLTLTGVAAGLVGTGNASSNILRANSVGSTLNAGAGDDYLYSGAGSDTLSGGLGNDTYFVDQSSDVVIEDSGEGTDTVYASTSYSLGANVENMMLTGGSVGTGNELNNVITAIGMVSDLLLSGGAGNDTLNGGSGNDRLDGGVGNDSMAGGLGNDTYIVDSTSDVITEAATAGIDTILSSVAYTASANVENLTLTGSTSAMTAMGNALDNVLIANDAGSTLRGADGNDTLIGGAGNDLLDGGSGAGVDTMRGGAGNDTYNVYHNGDTVTENAGEGTDLVQSMVSYALTSNVENLTLLGTVALQGTGNDLNNVIIGNNGGDNLYGGAGNDTLTGGTGNDWLDGGTGNDAMAGGAGNDTYVVDSINDVVTEAAAAGTDTVVTCLTYALSANLENLTLTGLSAGLTATGNASDNILTANDAGSTLVGAAGNDTLIGGAGDDSLVGGTGNDTYVVDQLGDIVTESTNEGTDTVKSSIDYTLGANVENLTLLGNATQGTGNDLDNILTANNLGNTLSGGAGNDTLNGGLGIDTLIGGLGNDTYYVNNSNDLVVENITEGTDTVYTSVNYTLSSNLENLVVAAASVTATGNELNNVISVSASVTAAVNLYGGAGADSITGGAGADYIDGGIGADNMSGGNGSDTYIVDNVGDVVNEVSTTGGTDKVISSLDWTLGANIENLTLTGAARNGRGNALNNAIVANDLGDSLFGVDGNDVLTGGRGNDVLDGGTGVDRMIGGLGDDSYYVDNASDSVLEIAGEGIDTVYSTINYSLAPIGPDNVENLVLLGGTVGAGNTLDNVITGNNLGNTLSGAGGNDTLIGGTGNDVIDGGTGVDRMQGGLGNDIYTVDDVSDVIIENANEGIDTVKSSISYSLGSNLENLTITGTANGLQGIGNSADNVIVGGSGGNMLSGGAGNDIITGGAGSDTLYGGDGNDTLDGGVGSNILDGGAGDDVYVVNSALDQIVEAVAAGVDTVKSYVGFTLGDNLENLQLLGTAAVGTGNNSANIINASAITVAASLAGGAGNDTLVGGSNNDILDGGAGDDAMSGGAGNDTYIVDSAGDTVTEIASAGTDTVKSSINYTLGVNVESLTLTGTSATVGTGNSLDNVLTANDIGNTLSGGAGNDTLIGGAGIDTLIGGVGNDIYVVGQSDDVVLENAAEGTDTVQAAANFVLGANIENLTLTGTLALSGTGNDLNNTLIANNAGASLFGGAGNDILTGGTGSDFLDGGSGNDTMSGGAGDDTYVVDSALDVVTEVASAGMDTVRSAISYTLGTNVENLVLTGTTSGLSATGNAADNVLTANDAGSTLSGGAGNDTLVGGAGSDTMIGGLGNDIYVVGQAGDVVTENANEGTDLVKSSVDYTLGANVENLTLLGTAKIGAGNALDNVITGNDAGDTLSGGLGNDTYYTNQSGDIIVENLNEGTDQVFAAANYVLAANLEKLTLLGAATQGAGNELNNTIVGNNLGNSLFGGAGNDTITGGTGDDAIDGGVGADSMAGGTGNDTYVVDNASDVITEAASAGIDNVQSSISYTLAANVENLTLTGTTSGLVATGNTADNVLRANSAGSTLSGGAGNDTFFGGAGNDTLIGGAGNDTFYLDQAGDVVTENASEGTDLVISSLNYTLGSNVENLTLVGGATQGAGNALDNVITANDLGNTLSGGAGNDTLIGGAGNDTMAGGLGNDIYIVDQIGDVITENLNEGGDTVKSSINYTLGANLEALVLTGTTATIGIGNDLTNYIDGNNAGNTLSGGGGADTIHGGTGDDVIDGGTEADMLYGGAGADKIYGGTGNDLLDGGDGNDILDGGTGNDNMSGGNGNDIYVVDSTGDTVGEIPGQGIDTVMASVSYTLGNYLENLTLTGMTANLIATGNTDNNVLRASDAGSVLYGLVGNDTLYGGLGADTLDGGDGVDVMLGGKGDDYYIVGSVADSVIELGGEGIDTVFTNLNSYTLGDNVENLTLWSASIGYGNSLNNKLTASASGNTLYGMQGDDTLIGGAANDVLDGGIGNDVMSGGAGNDTYIVDSQGDVVAELAGQGSDSVISSINYTLGANLENLTLSGAAIQGTGNALDNVLTANDLGNILNGGAGNDTLVSGAGIDTLIGGAGNDTYAVNDTRDIIVENAGEGADTVQASFSYVLGANLENLALIGSAVRGEGNEYDNVMTGNDLGNTLFGGAGNDTLVGGGGSDILDGGIGQDVMRGGAGNDTYIVDNQADQVVELVNGLDLGGIDTVRASLNYVLADQIENLYLMGGASVGTGNVRDNALFAGDVGATLNGLAGSDLLQGGAGDDILDGGTGVDLLFGGAGDDQLIDLSGNGALLGGAGNDTLTNGGGNYLVAGGSGSDVLNLSGARNILAFNRGDGTDTVITSSGIQNVISLGGGIRYADLSLSKNGNDLILNVGQGDSLTMKDWYSTTGKKSVTALQVFTEGGNFSEASSDPLSNHKVELFDFGQLVQTYDQSRLLQEAALQPVTAWAVVDGLLAAHLSGSDSVALGGDLAYQYAQGGSLTGAWLTGAQATVSDSQFSTSGQTLQRQLAAASSTDLKLVA